MTYLTDVPVQSVPADIIITSINIEHQTNIEYFGNLLPVRSYHTRGIHVIPAAEYQ